MRRLGIVLVVLLSVVVFTVFNGCPNVGVSQANYEQHGIYHGGKYLQSVGNDKELMASSSMQPDMTRRNKAWSRHSGSVYRFPRKTDFQYNPASMLLINIVPLDGLNPPTLTKKKGFDADGKPIGEAEVIFHKKGRYLLSYMLPFDATEQYILIEY